MKVVTEYIYPTEYDVQLTASGGGSSGSSSGGGSSEILAVVDAQNFTMREVGVILQGTPELSQGGQLINLHLHPQVVSDPTWKNYGMRLHRLALLGYQAAHHHRGAVRDRDVRLDRARLEERLLHRRIVVGKRSLSGIYGVD